MSPPVPLGQAGDRTAVQLDVSGLLPSIQPGTDLPDVAVRAFRTRTAHAYPSRSVCRSVLRAAPRPLALNGC